MTLAKKIAFAIGLGGTVCIVAGLGLMNLLFSGSSTPDIRRQVEQFIQSSKIILKDIGPIDKIVHQYGNRDTHHFWMDYSGTVFLAVIGDSGKGVLQLDLAGNNHKELSSIRGTWSFNAKHVPLNNEGNIDTFQLQYNRFQITKREYDRALEKNDCDRLLEIIDINTKDYKKQRDLQLSERRTTLTKAKCLQAAGRNKEAAKEYAKHAFFIKPHWFRESVNDLGLIDRSSKYIELALKLHPTDPRYVNQWNRQLEALAIQRELASDSCNKQLRSRLQLALKAMRVHYKNLPPCTNGQDFDH